VAGAGRARLGARALGRDPDPRARPIDEAQLQAIQELAFTQDAGLLALGAGLPARIAQAQAQLRGGTPTQGFGAGPAGETQAGAEGVVANATLYLDADVEGHRVAFIDQVATLRPFREQGLAGAVMTAAIAAADTWGADTIALFADADDWPQIMYAGMGFVTVGRQVSLHRDGTPGGSVSTESVAGD
jgi:GNAT superfamily N-acetyltransferase